MKLSKPIVVLDLETTGTWVEKDKIVEIGMIKRAADLGDRSRVSVALSRSAMARTMASEIVPTPRNPMLAMRASWPTRLRWTERRAA